MERRTKQRRDSYRAWLGHLRKEAGFSQQELSAITGIPQCALVYWDRTGKLTGRAIIITMAKALGVSVETLVRVDKHKM